MVNTKKDNSPPGTANYNGAIKAENGLCTEEKKTFLPLPEDKYQKDSSHSKENMGPIGPWATGKLDWSPTAGIAGVRPVVDHYTVSRYSEAEWRKHNEEILCGSAKNVHKLNMSEYSSRSGLKHTGKEADDFQHANTKRLGERANELLKWKDEVNEALKALTEEISLLEFQRKRTVKASGVLRTVYSISSECLACRGMREGQDLSKDVAEVELIKEAALIKEVGDLYERTLMEVQEQLVRNKTMKLRLENDWSDKQDAFEHQIMTVSLKNISPTVLFKPGSTRYSANQTSPESWERAALNLLQTAQEVMAQSCELRALLNGPLLEDCVKDLRAQGEKVDLALVNGIAKTEECVQAMIAELEVIAKKNAAAEKLKCELRQGILGIDTALKVAQTRLNILHQRPGIENCRDKAQYGLVDEVKSLSEQSALLKDQLEEHEKILMHLVHSRTMIERELQIKLKTIYIDKHRCQVIRAQYPSASAMAGFLA